MSSTTSLRHERQIGSTYIRKLRRISPAAWWSFESSKYQAAFKAAKGRHDSLEGVPETVPSLTEAGSSTCSSTMSGQEPSGSRRSSVQSSDGDKHQRHDSKNWPLPSEIDTLSPSIQSLTPDQDSQKSLRRSMGTLFKRQSWTGGNSQTKAPQTQQSWSTILSEATTVRHEGTWYDDQDSDEEEQPQPQQQQHSQPPPLRSLSRRSIQKCGDMPTSFKSINPLAQHPPNIPFPTRIPAISFPSITDKLQSTETHVPTNTITESTTTTSPSTSIKASSDPAQPLFNNPPPPPPSTSTNQAQPSLTSSPSPSTTASPLLLVPPFPPSTTTPPHNSLHPRLHDVESLLADLLRRFADTTTQTRTHHTLLTDLSLSSSAALSTISLLTSRLDALQSANDNLATQLEALKMVVDGLGIQVGGLGMQVEAIAEVAREGEFGVWEVGEKGRRVEGRVGGLEERVWLLELGEKEDDNDDDDDEDEGQDRSAGTSASASSNNTSSSSSSDGSEKKMMQKAPQSQPPPQRNQNRNKNQGNKTTATTSKNKDKDKDKDKHKIKKAAP